MSCKGMELAIYTGESNWDWAKRGFEIPRLPSWNMEKSINNTISCKQMKLSDYLPLPMLKLWGSNKLSWIHHPL